VEKLAVFRADLPLFKEVNFNLADGQAIQISGANGSGKTSLLRCLCGISHRHEGSISWNGRIVADPDSGFNTQLLYLGHSLGLKPKLTVQQNLEFYQKLRFSANSDVIQSTLSELQLGSYHDEMVGNLSAGQKRRVSLCRLRSEPVDLWVLDEPMVALDHQGQDWLERTCNNHLANGGMIILTSHQTLTGINGLEQLILERPDFSKHLPMADAG
jgi:heme exporter protein A